MQTLANVSKLPTPPTLIQHMCTWSWSGSCVHPQLIFLPKLGFLEFIWIFRGRNHFKINFSHISNPNLTKWIPLNLAHWDLSNNTKGTFQFLQKFQPWFNSIFNEKIIQYSRTFAMQVQTPCNQAHAPLLVKSFPKRPRMWSEASWFGGSHQYKTEQTTYLAS